MEERTFTWFPKLTRVMASLPPELAAAFAVAVANYGTYGSEPSFENPLMEAVFEGVREDIDNSANNRSKNKGGRPIQKKAQCEPENNPGYEAQKPGFETKETPVFENENPGFDTPETPVTEVENPSYIYQAKPSHTKPKKKEGAARMARPTLQEVEECIRRRGYHVDAAAFMAFYDSNGWKVGKNPMKSWESALTTWERRDSPGGKGAGDADFSRFG